MDVFATVADLLFNLPKNYGLVFDTIHYIVCIQSERADLGDKFEDVTRNNPLASWISAMMICFAGALLTNPLCGEAPLEAIEDPIRIAIATALWYVMFFSPKDVVYKFTKKLPAQVPIYALKGLYYPKKIVAGLKLAKSTLDRRNVFASVIVATVKANGSQFMMPFARFMRGTTDKIESMQSLKPSSTTKYCFFCALLYALFPGDLSYCIIAGLLIAMKVGPLFDVPVDVFEKAEEKVLPHVFRKNEKVEVKNDKEDEKKDN